MLAQGTIEMARRRLGEGATAREICREMVVINKEYRNASIKSDFYDGSGAGGSPSEAEPCNAKAGESTSAGDEENQ